MIRHCLKIFALALIVFPEPITTALGIALLSLIAAFSLQKRLSKFGDLEGLIKRSLKAPTPDEFGSKIFKAPPKVLHKLRIIATRQPGELSGEPNEVKTLSPIVRIVLNSGDQPAFDIDTRRFSKIGVITAPPMARTKLHSDNQPTPDVDTRRFSKIGVNMSPPVARTKLHSGDQPTSDMDTRRFSKIGIIRPAVSVS
jgi:hypothetical protein